jgi:hypothetical protein
MAHGKTRNTRCSFRATFAVRFSWEKIVRTNVGGCFKIKSAETPHQCLSYKSDFVGRTERSDLRRMRKFETHPAGFALLSPPYELRSTPATMPAVARMTPAPAVVVMVSPRVTGCGNGIRWRDVDDAHGCGIYGSPARCGDHAAGEGGG